MTEQDAYATLDGTGYTYLERVVMSILLMPRFRATQIADEVRRLKACEAECERLRAEVTRLQREADEFADDASVECSNAAKYESASLHHAREWREAMAEVEKMSAEIVRLRMELTGEQKARALLMAGMESQAELMDTLKQKVRAAEAGKAKADTVPATPPQSLTLQIRMAHHLENVRVTFFHTPGVCNNAADEFEQELRRIVAEAVNAKGQS